MSEIDGAWRGADHCREAGTSGGASVSLLEPLAELLWPTRCVVCNRQGELLCPDCRADLKWIEQRNACPHCGTPHGRLGCTGCGGELIRARRRSSWATTLPEAGAVGLSSEQRAAGDAPDDPRWETRATICALEFAGAGARLATILKDAHELRLARVIAAVMATALDEASAWPAGDGRPRFDASGLDAVCFVPATAKAYTRRGYDHMELVATALARVLGLPVADVLVRDSRRDQRRLGREERQENLRGSVGVVGDVSGARLLLVDDVVTTGSTLRESARTLIARGAAPPTACGLARVW